jgi:Txe/YoeB family toxin of Txe-Axe toxin-antitoxin module
MNFNFLFPKKTTKILPEEKLPSFTSSSTSSSTNLKRIKTQKKFSKRVKTTLQNIRRHPFDTFQHLQENEREINDLWSSHEEQIYEMVENQKLILEMSLRLFQCRLLSSSKIQKQSSSLDIWNETTRDLYTHFEILRLQQNDLLKLQEEDITKLEKLLSEWKCPPLKIQQQQQKNQKTIVQQIFGKE